MQLKKIENLPHRRWKLKLKPSEVEVLHAKNTNKSKVFFSSDFQKQLR